MAQKVERRGGKRSNAGRKKGSKGKRTEAQIAKAEAGGEMPLDFMLQVMRTPELTKAGKESAISKARRYQAAKDAAPYLHPKLSSVEQTHKFDWSKVPLEQLKELERILSAAAGESTEFPPESRPDQEPDTRG